MRHSLKSWQATHLDGVLDNVECVSRVAGDVKSADHAAAVRKKIGGPFDDNSQVEFSLTDDDDVFVRKCLSDAVRINIYIGENEEAAEVDSVLRSMSSE